MQKAVEFPVIQLVAFTIAEITRFKFPGLSVAPKQIEAGMRERFAKAFGGGLKKNSKPELFLRAIHTVNFENKTQDKFAETLKRFKLTPEDFPVF